MAQILNTFYYKLGSLVLPSYYEADLTLLFCRWYYFWCVVLKLFFRLLFSSWGQIILLLVKWTSEWMSRMNFTWGEGMMAFDLNCMYCNYSFRLQIYRPWQHFKVYSAKIMYITKSYKSSVKYQRVQPGTHRLKMWPHRDAVVKSYLVMDRDIF